MFYDCRRVQVVGRSFRGIWALPIGDRSELVLFQVLNLAEAVFEYSSKWRIDVRI